MQKRNLHQSLNLFTSTAGLFKAALLAVVITNVLSVKASAQLDCDAITESPRDIARFMRVTGAPLDTVWVPVFVQTDSVLSGFNIIVQWDSNKVTPLTTYDPVDNIFYVATQLTGRFVHLQGSDTVTNFFSQISLNPDDSGAIICGYNIGAPGDSIIFTPAGSGVIFRIGFRIFGNIQHNDSARVKFYEIQPRFIPPPPDPPIFFDCHRTDMSVEWHPLGVPDSTYPVTLYPTTVDGFIVVDSAPKPQINNFSAQNPTIQIGSTTLLNYTVNKVDSIRITGSSFSFGVISPTPKGTLQGQVIISPNPQATGYYKLTAYNVNGSSVDSTLITVTTGGGGGPNPNAPQISFPDGNSFTIKQGETVSFKVRATDPDLGNIVTLRANSLPNNANFAQVVATTTVEGTFSFTPDFNQSGTFSITFTASDNTGQSNNATATVIVEELQFDRLFSTSALNQAPVGGLRGKKNIVFPLNMITRQTVYGIQFDMAYDQHALRLDSFVVTPRTPDYVIYDDIGGSPGQVRVVAFGLSNDSIITDTSNTAVLNSYWSLDSNAVEWTDYLIDLSDGRESIDPNPAVPSLQLLTDDGVIQCDKPGDVNLDKFIDVADLVNIVAYIIGNFGLPVRQFETADIIRNDTVDVFDLVGTINTIFGIPVSPVPPPPIAGEPAVLALEYNDLYAGQTEMLTIKSDLPERVAAAELVVKFDPKVVALGAPQLGADAKGMALQYKGSTDGTLKIVMHITNPFNVNQQLPVGAGIEMLKIPMYAQRIVEAGNTKQLKLNKAQLSTANSASIPVQGIDDTPILPESFELFQNYPNPFNPVTTIEFSIAPSEDGALVQQTNLDIYNILGQRVRKLVDENLSTGRYRVEWNSTNESGQRVATGVYFYRLVVGQHAQSKKMLLIK